MSKQDFIPKALLLLTSTSLNRYTLSSTLMEALLGFLRTPDLKYMAIAHADEMLKARSRIGIPEGYDHAAYQECRKRKQLAEYVVRSHLRLSETEEALDYFEKHHTEKDPEVKLYIVVKLLFEYKRKDEIVRAIIEAQEKRTKPRDSLLKLKSYIEQHRGLPEHII
jgi:tetratricopeptide (TPR) repeat protein